MADLYDNLDPGFAGKVQALINASGGRVRPGSGFRTVEQQIVLRRKNGCPDVWSSPASSCRVPTAIPGRSQHNHGRAMDLQGDLDWANENAARFGLHFPVKGENWHVEAIDDDGQGGTAGPGWMEETQDPQEELASRLHAVMRIIGKRGGETPVEQSFTATKVPVKDQIGPAAQGGDVADPSGYGAYARKLMERYGWDENEYRALVELWNKESGDPKAGASRVTWNPEADNPSSTAYGIAQFLNGTWAGTGIARTSDPYKQIEAGAIYISKRYRSPSRALTFHRENNWY